MGSEFSEKRGNIFGAGGKLRLHTNHFYSLMLKSNGVQTNIKYLQRPQIFSIQTIFILEIFLNQEDGSKQELILSCN